MSGSRAAGMSTSPTASSARGPSILSTRRAHSPTSRSIRSCRHSAATASGLRSSRGSSSSTSVAWGCPIGSRGRQRSKSGWTTFAPSWTRAAVMGESEGGPLAMLFAAAHPERTAALILQGAEVRERTDDEWPWGEDTEEEFESAMAVLPERWGKGLGIDWIAPSVAGQQWAHAWWARVQVHSSTPGAAEAFMRMAFDIDVRHVAPAINVPTLIVHARGEKVCHVENARFLSRTIPRVRYVELPGEDHVPWFAPDD